MIQIKIDPSFDGMLLRDYLFDQLSLSNNLVKKAKSEKGQILINNVKKTVRYQLKAGDILQITFPPEQVSKSFIKSDIPLKILYEDDDIIILDKQASIPTIPSYLHPENTIANGLLYYYDQIGLQSTIHVVTRLDKDTSGAMLVAKHQYSHSILSQLQKQFLVKRKYVAIVHGYLLQDEGTIDAPIDRKIDSLIEREVSVTGKRAVTHFKVLKRIDKYSVVEIELETGRTHQIRVHFSHIGHPLIGDSLYGFETEKNEIQRTALHCSEISFPHPMTKKQITQNVPIHKDMAVYLNDK